MIIELTKDERIEVIVDDDVVYRSPEPVLTEEQEKEETKRHFKESLGKLTTLLRQLAEKDIDVSAQLAELVNSKGGDV